MPLPNKMDYAELGGEKADFEAVVDSETELSAEEINATRCAVAAMSRTVSRGWVKFSYDVAFDGYVEVEDHDAVWGNDASTAPEVVWNSVGLFTITLPSTVTDERGEEVSVNIIGGFANAEAAGRITNVVATSATTLTVRVYDISDQALDNGNGDPIWVHYIGG